MYEAKSPFLLLQRAPKPSWRPLGGILETSWRLLEGLGGVLDASWKHLESKDVFLGFPWRSREGWELREYGLVVAMVCFRALPGNKTFWLLQAYI